MSRATSVETEKWGKMVKCETGAMSLTAPVAHKKMLKRREIFWHSVNKCLLIMWTKIHHRLTSSKIWGIADFFSNLRFNNEVGCCWMLSKVLRFLQGFCEIKSFPTWEQWSVWNNTWSRPWFIPCFIPPRYAIKKRLKARIFISRWFSPVWMIHRKSREESVRIRTLLCEENDANFKNISLAECFRCSRWRIPGVSRSSKHILDLPLVHNFCVNFYATLFFNIAPCPLFAHKRVSLYIKNRLGHKITRIVECAVTEVLLWSFCKTKSDINIISVTSTLVIARFR